MVGERPVELAEEDLELERETVEDPGHDQPPHAVGGVGHDPQRAQGRHVDERADVGGELVEHVPLRDRAPLLERLDPALGVGHHGLDVLEPGVLADGSGPGQAQLDAVVARGIVGGGEHGPGTVELAGREVQEIGRHHPEVDDVGPLAGDALGERGRQLDARRAHVPAHEHTRRSAEMGEGGAHGASSRRVELVGHGPAHVIGLEDGVQRSHPDGHSSGP